MGSTDSDWVMGFGGSDHDYSAALMHGTDIQIAIEAERVTRVKYGKPAWFEDPLAPCAAHCLEVAGVAREEVTRTVSSDFLPQRTIDRWSIKTHNHHRCHAASAVMLLPPDVRACVLVYDGAGSTTTAPSGAGASADYETFSFYEYVDGQLTLLGSTSGERYHEPLNLVEGGTNSMGQLYELVTMLIGFDQLEAGKTMGLAGWGSPRLADDLMRHIRFGEDLEQVFSFDPYSDEVQALLREHLERHGHSFSAKADMAASVQEILTRCLLHCYGLVAEREFEVFALAGGCALNTVANGVLAKRLGEGRRLLVPAHAGDAGIALGSLWLDAVSRSDEPVELTLRGRPLMPALARPGRTYPAERIRRSAAAALSRSAEDPTVTGPESLARVLSAGALVGVFNGSSEIGPRALGGRSLLADPREARMKERINRTVKHREPFRPLAPIVLEERYDEYFAPRAAANPFMLVVADASERCRREAPAVVHVDGSARVQLLPEASDEFLERLLREFHALTGVGVLLNTSFNRRGEPIVETPEEAVSAFLEMGLDGLWMDGTYVYALR